MEVDVSSNLRDPNSDQITAVKIKRKNHKNRKEQNCMADENNSNSIEIENSEEVNHKSKKKNNGSVGENSYSGDANKSRESCMTNETNSNSIECSVEVQPKIKKVQPGKRERYKLKALRLNDQCKSSCGDCTKVDVVSAAENRTNLPGGSIVNNDPELVGGTVSDSATKIQGTKKKKINKGNSTELPRGTKVESGIDLQGKKGKKKKKNKSERQDGSDSNMLENNNITCTLGTECKESSKETIITESCTDLQGEKKKKKKKKKKIKEEAVNEEAICEEEGYLKTKQTSLPSSPVRGVKEPIAVTGSGSITSENNGSGSITTENNRSGSSCLSDAPVVPKELVLPGKKKLLVLDINGLLADINGDYSYTQYADFKISGKLVFKRPFCADFLNFCFANFEIGVWSSRNKYNVEKAVQYLIGDLKNKLLFCWDQSKCTATNFNTIDNSHKPLVLKELKKLWEKEEPDLPWEKGQFTPSNTLLVDDSPYKALCNPPFTAIFPHPYSFKHKEDNSLDKGGDLRVYLEKVATAEHVQYFVKENPFGQPAITDSHPEWKYYLRIIDNLDKPLVY